MMILDIRPLFGVVLTWWCNGIASVNLLLLHLLVSLVAIVGNGVKLLLGNFLKAVVESYRLVQPHAPPQKWPST